jgi:RND family efflux transporter MFP subunit
MVPRAFIGGLVLAVLALVGGVATLRRGPQPVQPVAAPRPETPPPDPARETTRKGWLGVLISEESLDMAARLDGRVESVKVQVGSVVRQGELLVKLDTKSQQEDLSIAEAELASIKAELEVAQLSLEQSQERLRRREAPEQLALQALSQEELSAARYEQRTMSAKLEVARARVREQEVRVEQLRQKVADASLRAPFDGVVAGRFVHPQALVRSGQPLLHLSRRDRPQVRFAIPAQESGSLAVGQPVKVELEERRLTLEGRVTQLAPEVDVATLMVFALADVEVAAGTSVPAGLAVRVKASDMQPPRVENQQ